MSNLLSTSIHSMSSSMIGKWTAVIKNNLNEATSNILSLIYAVSSSVISEYLKYYTTVHNFNKNYIHRYISLPGLHIYLQGHISAHL